MRKIAMLLLTILLSIGFAGCAEKTVISLPFDITEINHVEMYRYIVPSSAEKKIVTESDDIAQLYAAFSDLEICQRTIEPTAGSPVTIFLFHLSDGANYKITYCEDGILKFPAEQLDGCTSVCIGIFWEKLQKYEPVSIKESELP